MSLESSSKVCLRCSADVRATARVKDAKGRYFCRPCFDALAAAKAAKGGQPIAADRPAAPDTDEPIHIDGIHSPEAAAAFPHHSNDDNAMIFDIAPVGPAPGTQGGPCPGCGQFLRAGVAVCVNCGFNTLTGQSLSTSVGVEKVKTTRESERDSHLKQASREAHRKAYINAISVIVFGVVATLIILGTMTDNFAQSATFVGLTMGLCIPAAFVAFLLFALAGQAGGVGFFLIFLEIAAVCCGYMPLLVLELMYPMPRLVRYGLRALVLGGLSYWLLDMDEPANYVFAVVVFVLMLGSAVGAAIIMGG